jgi:hypothetical protein
MTILELCGAGLGAIGSLLALTKFEDIRIKIGAYCITVGFILPVYSLYTHPLNWWGIGIVTLVILSAIIGTIWRKKKIAKKV